MLNLNKIYISAAFGLLALVGSISYAKALEEYNYHLTYVNKGRPHLLVELEFQGTSSGVSCLLKFMDEKILSFTPYASVEVLSADTWVSNQAIYKQQDDFFALILRHQPNAKVKLRYKVYAAADGYFRRGGLPGTVIGKEVFSVSMWDFLLQPVPLDFKDMHNHDAVRINVKWDKPVNGAFINHTYNNSLQHSMEFPAKSIFYKSGHERQKAILLPYNAYYIGGKIKTKSFDILGKRFDLAVFSELDRIDINSFGQKIHDILQQQRLFFSDNDFTKVSFFVYDMVAAAESYIGVAIGRNRKNILTILPERAGKAALDARLTLLVDHESRHSWLSPSMYDKSDTYAGTEHDATKWFFEGFNEYLCFLNNLRMGFIGLDRYLNRYNDALLYAFHIDEYIGLSFADSMLLSQEAIYHTGFLYASSLQSKLAQEGASSDLETYLQRLLSNYFSDKNNIYLFDKAAVDKVFSGSGLDFHAAVQHANYAGLDLENFDVRPFGPCVTLKKEKMVNLLGINFEATAHSGIVQNLAVKSKLYRDGLREGDSIVSMGLLSGSPHKFELTVLKNGKRIQYIFEPDRFKHKDFKTLYSLELDKEMYEKNPEYCMSGFKKLEELPWN